MGYFDTLSDGGSDAFPMVVSGTSPVGVLDTFPTAMSACDFMGFKSAACLSCEVSENMLDFL